MHREYQPKPNRPQPSGTRRRFAWWALLPWLVAGYAATGFYTVQPNERAVVRRCGKALEDLRGPGPHFGFPWGVDRVDKLKPRQYQRVAVGTSLTGRAVGRQALPMAAECLTGDRNLIVVPAVVQFQIADSKKYLLDVADVPAVIRSVTASTLSSVISSMNVDDVLTVRRTAIQNQVRQASQELLDRYGAGVTITSVSLEGLGPPQEPEVAAAFRDVTAAREDRQREINQAKGYQHQLLPQARGQADRILVEAAAYGDEILERSRGHADHFRSFSAELSDDPKLKQLTFKRLVLETVEEVLPRLKKKIVLDRGAGEMLDLGLIEVDQ